MVAPDPKEHTVRRTVTTALIALTLIAAPTVAANAATVDKAPTASFTWR